MKWACQLPVSKLLAEEDRDAYLTATVETLLNGYSRTGPLSVRWVDNATDPVTVDIYRSMGVEPAEYMVALVECEVSTCSLCDGTGHFADDIEPCPRCDGAGRVDDPKTLAEASEALRIAFARFGDALLKALRRAMSERTIAALAVLDLEQKKLIIDGFEFPWYFGNDWTVNTNGVTLTIFADVVEVRR